MLSKASKAIWNKKGRHCSSDLFSIGNVIKGSSRPSIFTCSQMRRRHEVLFTKSEPKGILIEGKANIGKNSKDFFCYIFFPNIVLISAATDGAARIFLPPYAAAACFRNCVLVFRVSVFRTHVSSRQSCTGTRDLWNSKDLKSTRGKRGGCIAQR